MSSQWTKKINWTGHYWRMLVNQLIFKMYLSKQIVEFFSSRSSTTNKYEMIEYHHFVTPNEFTDLDNNHNGIYME